MLICLITFLFSFSGIYAEIGWQTHVDGLFAVADTVTHAAIIDKGGEVWAKDSGFKPSIREIKRILSFFNRPFPPPAQNYSFILMGNEFEILQGGIGSLLGRHSNEAFFGVATRELVICVMYERTGPKNIIIRNAVYQMAQYLKMIGY